MGRRRSEIAGPTFPKVDEIDFELFLAKMKLFNYEELSKMNNLYQ
ncbi:hypothetical protein [Jeotgalicoccus sp. FSL K6-3177]